MPLAAYRTVYDAVIVITIGSGFSSCYQNACVAARQFEQVYVVDSANLSSGQGLLVLLAAQLAQMQQMEPQQICQKLKEAAQDACQLYPRPLGLYEKGWAMQLGHSTGSKPAQAKALH